MWETLENMIFPCDLCWDRVASPLILNVLNSKCVFLQVLPSPTLEEESHGDQTAIRYDSDSCFQYIPGP
jgi:hypothetical protein